MILFMYFLIICLVNINCNEHDTTDEKKVDVPVPTNMALDLVRGELVDMWVYSEKIEYCKLVNPRGTVFYEHFGRCRLILDRVTMEHHGHWEMHVGYPEVSTLNVETLYVNVIEPESKTKVHTVVEESSPNIMTMTCSLPSDYQLQGCKFRGPHDMIILASGTIEKTININGTRYESHLGGSECSFRITNPKVKDLGFWRCAMFTENDIYYGFLTVISSWFLNETAVVESIRRGPTLRLDHHREIDVLKGEPVTVSCSIDAPIRYCYLWMSDGTVLNVSPGVKSSSMEYVGSGFDAGECSLKVYDLDSFYSRRWSCNIALAAGTQQSREFFVTNANDRMQVSQTSHGSLYMFLNGKISNSELEYCRYVNDGGFGFPYDKTPPGYEFIGSLSDGICELKIHFPNTWSDYSPWTIIAKVKGEDEEISGRTRGVPIPNVPEYVSYTNGWQIFGWVMLAVVITGILLGVSVGPQRNRQWIARRATIVRQSLRRQQPPPYTPAI